MHTQFQTDPNARPKPKTVLVIEEERFTLLTLWLMIKNAGYRVVSAGDGAEALKAIRLERPALILADVNQDSGGASREWDAFKLMDWMKYQYPEHRTECIIVSAGDPEKIRHRATEAGAFGFVAKPITKSLLLAEIKRAIGDPCDVARHGETTFFRRHIPLE
jgi:CheY-like chemotaxis protein